MDSSLSSTAFGIIISLLLANSTAVLFCLWCRWRRGRNSVAFFHPYCNACGGGERVLWCAISAMQKKFGKNYQYIVYTGDSNVLPNDLLQKAEERFGFTLDAANLQFVYLKLRPFVEAKYYPVFTLALQAMGGLILGIEALLQLSPKIFIDTMGYPCTLPLFRWIAGSEVACYVHYPMISSDMIDFVETKQHSFNNAQWIAKNWTASTIKVYYYKLFAYFYKLCGLSCNVVMVNGTWTMNHINNLWNIPDKTHLLYPPCDVKQLLRLSSKAESILNDENVVQILSIGQIRPEKDHKLQLKILSALKNSLSTVSEHIKARLVICGGCRDDGDIARSVELQDFADNLGLTKSDLSWSLNASFTDLTSLLQNSLVGLHTMNNEHFGISIVECLASGLIMIAHDSGGPKLDIISPSIAESDKLYVGLRASSIEEYVQFLVRVIKMSPKERESVRLRAKSSVERFSDENFSMNWNRIVALLFA